MNSSIYQINSKNLDSASDFRMLSKLGNIELPRGQTFDVVHIGGGFCNICMQRALAELIGVMKVAKSSNNKPKQIFIHLSQVYGKKGTINNPQILRNDLMDGKIDLDYDDIFIDLALKKILDDLGFSIPKGEILSHDNLGHVIRYPFSSGTEHFDLVIVP